MIFKEIFQLIWSLFTTLFFYYKRVVSCVLCLFCILWFSRLLLGCYLRVSNENVEWGDGSVGKCVLCNVWQMMCFLKEEYRDF